MEMSFSELRTKEVVNITDGRRLGKVCDIVFCYPENRILGIVVPGCKGFGFKRSEQFIEMKNIVKIGDDVVLVNFNMPPKPCGRKPGRGCNPPPPCGPGGTPGGGNGMGGTGNPGGHGGSGYFPSNEYPPQYPGRRSYEEYE